MEQDISEIIQNSLPNFPLSQHKLAEFILEHPTRITELTIDQLSACCAVSIATISRFCKRIGLKSYQKLKIQLASSLSSRKEKERQIGTYIDNNILDSAKQIISRNLRCEENALDLLVTENVKSAAAVLAQANRILFFGTPENSFSAIAACGKFMQSTTKAVCFPDVHMQKMAASMVDKRDAVLLIADGHPSDTAVSLFTEMKFSGAELISLYPVNGFSGAYNSLMSDIMYFEPSDPFSAGESVQNFLIDILLVEFVKAKEEYDNGSLQR